MSLGLRLKRIYATVPREGCRCLVLFSVESFVGMYLFRQRKREREKEISGREARCGVFVILRVGLVAHGPAQYDTATADRKEGGER